jgi:hypothetical protein
MNRCVVVLTRPKSSRFRDEETNMFCRQMMKPALSAGYGHALESRWLDDTPGRRLLGHIMFALLSVALALAGIALCL